MMPSAPDHYRNLMQEWFGDAISEAGPVQFLTDAGYVLGKDWRWSPKPGVEKIEDMTNKEYDCLAFLVYEWDFGGLKEFLQDETADSFAQAILAERERISAVIEKWKRRDHLSLHAGEVTAQEFRTVVAVLTAVEGEVLSKAQ